MQKMIVNHAGNENETNIFMRVHFLLAAFQIQRVIKLHSGSCLLNSSQSFMYLILKIDFLEFLLNVFLKKENHSYDVDRLVVGVCKIQVFSRMFSFFEKKIVELLYENEKRAAQQERNEQK